MSDSEESDKSKLEALWLKATSTIPIIEAFVESVESELEDKLTAGAEKADSKDFKGNPSLESAWSSAVEEMSASQVEPLTSSYDNEVETLPDSEKPVDTNWHDEDNQVVVGDESPFSKVRDPIGSSVIPVFGQAGNDEGIVTSVPLPVFVPIPVPTPVPMEVPVVEESQVAGANVVLPGSALGSGQGEAGSPVSRKPRATKASGKSTKSAKVAKPVVPILNARTEGLTSQTLAKAKRTAARKAKAGHMIGGVRLTARDYAMLTFLARYRVATVGQLARAFGTSSTALRNRLPRLNNAGLITWVWGASSKPKLWMITEAGLETVGIHLTAPTIKWGQLRHTMGLTDLGIHFETNGETVLTEREIRAAATRYSPTTRMRSAIGLIGGSSYDLSGMSLAEANEATAALVRSKLILPVKGRAYGHIPDMVLSRQPFPNGASANISIELELTRKSMSEWNTILSTYNNSDAFAEVLYFVISGDIRRALNLVIKSISASDKIKVIMFSPVDLTADPVVTGGGGQIKVNREIPVSPGEEVPIGSSDSQDAPGYRIPIPTDD